MKKVVLGLLVTAFTSVSLGLGSAGALGVPGQTDITGVVTENQMAVPGASVTTLCNGNTRTDTTNAQGTYLTIYPKTQCDFGDTVKVTAVKSGKSGVNSGTVQGFTTKLNVAIINVSIPEFGLLGAVMAGGAGMGTIAYMHRRRKQE